MEKEKLFELKANMLKERAYQKDLEYHINVMEKAAADPNPLKFKYAFNAFKVFVVAYWN